MDIKEVKQAKKKLENDIFELLVKFKELTQCDIDSIKLIYIDTSSHECESKNIYEVKLDVKI